MKTKRDESKNYPRHPAHRFRARERACESESTVAAQSETEKHGYRVNCQRTQAQREEREKGKRNAVAMFTEGERVTQRIEEIRVEEIERISKRLVIVPPED